MLLVKTMSSSLKIGRLRSGRISSKLIEKKLFSLVFLKLDFNNLEKLFQYFQQIKESSIDLSRKSLIQELKVSVLVKESIGVQLSL